MERRTFLKNIFGAAVIATMPKIVVDQIESLPETPTISPVIKKAIIPPNGLLYLYDDKEEKLIGASSHFSLDFKQNYVELENKYGWIEYTPGTREWNVTADNIQWVNNPREYFEENRRLRCLITKGEYKINGEIYITQLEFMAPQFEQLPSSAEFQGSGALIIE